MISVSGLCVDLGGRRVVDEVSLDVAAGEFAAITGPNGAGKSTVLKALAGAIPIARGAVAIDAIPVASMAPIARARRLAWLPQARPVAWSLRVADLVALGRFAASPAPYDRLGSADRQAVDAALEKSDAAHLASRSFHDLSGGEQARVHLARLLASPAPCLALDEPCAALDIAHQLALMETLGSEAAGGRAVLVVLHDLDLARRYCSRLIVMNRGRMVSDAEPEAALSDDVLKTVFNVRRDAAGNLIRAG
jgi:iron complex transport system ATP-binding protein